MQFNITTYHKPLSCSIKPTDCEPNVNTIPQNSPKQTKDGFPRPDANLTKLKHLKLKWKTVELLSVNRQARGHWFESSIAHHILQGFQAVDPFRFSPTVVKT